MAGNLRLEQNLLLGEIAMEEERRDSALPPVKDRAYSTIYLSIEKEYRILITHTEDSAVTWDVHTKHLRPNTRARTISLLDTLLNCKYVEGEEKGLYATRLKKIVSQSQFSETGHPLKDIQECQLSGAVMYVAINS